MYLEVCLMVGALLLVGALISLTAWARPVRSLCQRSLAARSVVLCILGLASFAIGFGGVTRLEAQTIYVFGAVTIVDTFESEGLPITYPPAENAPGVVRGLWVRLLLPPPLRQRCYTGEPWVCAETNGLVHATPARWDWSAYGRDVGMGSISAVASILCVYWFTRQSQG